MVRKNRAARVLYRWQKAGILRETGSGYEFRYDPVYLGNPGSQAISLSLPLRSAMYESPRLFSFFDGLLPEGWLLDVTSSTANIDANDKFGLLLHTGEDPIGAVSILPLDDPRSFDLETDTDSSASTKEEADD